MRRISPTTARNYVAVANTAEQLAYLDPHDFGGAR